MDRRILAAVSGVTIAGLAAFAPAAPYASGVTEAGGNVTFILNEPSSNVVVIRDGVPTSLGALGVGSHTFARSGATNYSIQVQNNTTTPGYQNASAANVGSVLQISDDNNIRNSFNSPRGLIVNTNPAGGTNFGRIYIANSAPGTTRGPLDPAPSPTPIRTVTDGIYVNHADGSDPLAQGDNALTAAIDFSLSTNSPFRLALDRDGFLYISDWADATGTVYRTDANVSAGGNLFVGQGGTTTFVPTTDNNHGSVPAVYVDGTSAAGNLTVYTLDEDLSPLAPADAQRNSLWRYDIGNGTTSGNNTIPTQLAHPLIDFVPGVYVDMTRGPDGKFYLAQFRSNGDEDGIYVVTPDGLSVVYASREDTIARGYDADDVLPGVQDVLRQTRSIAVSPDGQWLGLVLNSSDAIAVPMIDGIPDIPNRLVIDTFEDLAAGRDVAFDAAGNLYIVTSGRQSLRVFSPGKVSLTTLNSNGTVEVHNEPEWFVTGGGNASSTGNWMLSYRPDGVGETAMFGNAITAPATVNLDAPQTLGFVKFNSPHKYTIGGGNTLTLDSFGEPRITVMQGSHDITAPVVANQNLQMTAIPANSVLTVSNLTMTGGSTGNLSITTAGAGVVAANNYRAAALNVRSGTARVLPNGTSAGTSNVRALNIAGGTTPTATLDITNNAFVVDYDPVDAEPFDTIKAQIVSGYNGGAWNGPGIISSQADAGNFGVGYSEASALTSVPAIFGTVDGTAVLFRRTRYGDANLDGQVNLQDFNRLAGNFGSTTANWDQGDFNYDGTVNLTDFNRLAGNFGLSAGPDGPTPDDWAALAAAVPEPSGLLLVVAGATMLARRRRVV